MMTVRTILTTVMTLGVAFCLNISSLSYAVQKNIQQNIRPAIMESFGSQPLLFIKNDGQLDKKVKYYEQGSNHATYFTEDGIYLSLFQNQKTTGQHTSSCESNSLLCRTETVKVTFVNGAGAPLIKARDIQQTRYNYYIGNDPHKWREGILTYKTVTYTEIYKNIDLKVYGSNRRLEYDIIVKPGGDPQLVKFKYEGARSLAVNERGELEIKLDHGSVIQKSPSLYQEISGRKVKVSGQFKLLADNTYTFAIAAYDHARTLVIDPVIEYSRYLAGDWSDWANAVAVDDVGNVYVTGKTDSTYFPGTAFPHDVNEYKNDIFVYKADSSGTRLYVTVFGGTAYDVTQYSIIEEGKGIAADSHGNAHVIGVTMSADFPTTPGAIQETFAGYQADTCYTVLGPSGSIAYSTYFGGEDTERGAAIAVADSGTACDVYIAGSTAPYNTHAPDFPTTSNALQPAFGGVSDGFIAKINFDNTTPADTSLVFATYFGGNGSDGIAGIALDNSENIYITGSTSSSNLPGASASTIQSAFGGTYDAFAAKINAAGTAIVYSTYLGGNRSDFGKAIAVDDLGGAYVAGDVVPPSNGTYNFPLVHPIQGTPGGGQYDAFAAKINAAGTALDYSTFLGGALSDRARGIAVDSQDSAFVVGETSSADFPVENAISGHDHILGDTGREVDGFVTRLSPLGTTLIYSTFLGGGGNNVIGDDNAGTDSIHGIALDSSGNAWVAGMTTSHSFPGASGYDKLYDGFISKISDNSAMPPEVFSVTPLAGAVNVLISTSPISATFSRDMDINSFNGNISLATTIGGVAVSGTTGNNGWHVIEFTPSEPLAYETQYTVTITTGVTDTAGTPLPADYSWEFTTEPEGPDITPPTVVSTVPDTSPDYENRVEVPLNAVVQVTFSEAMDQDTMISDNLFIRDDLWNIYNSTVSYNPATMTATITPDADLPYGTDFTLMVLYRVADQAGNTMGNTYSGWFKTACDPLSPTLISSIPGNSASGVSIDTGLSFTFSADMDESTLNENNIQISYYYAPSSTFIDGSFSYATATRTLTFTPAESLPAGTMISAFFQKAVADTAGRHICYPSDNEPTYVYFTTEDLDGVSDQEEQGPDGTDVWYNGNGDYYADWTQANVTSLHTADGSQYVTLSCPAGEFLQGVTAIANPSSGNTPSGATFPFGFFNFTITGLEAGGTTSLTINLPAGETVNSYWKYGPTPDNNVPHWYNFMYDNVTGTGAVINGSEIVLNFVDGQRGDDDLTPDAKIIEPGAPGILESAFDFTGDNDVDGSDLAEFARRLSEGSISGETIASFASAYGR